MLNLLYLLKSHRVFEAAIAAAIVIMIYTAARVIFLKAKKLPRKPMNEEICRALLAGYFAALVMMVWFPWDELRFIRSGMIKSWADLIEIGDYTNNMWLWGVLSGKLHDGYIVFELLANVALFVPYGFLIPMIWRKLKWWAVWLICLGTTAAVELLQPLVARTGDLDDVLTNFIGGIIGCSIAKLILKIINSRKTA